MVDKKINSRSERLSLFIAVAITIFAGELQHIEKKQMQRAVKLFERAVKLTDKEPVFQIQLAAVLSEIGEYERSTEILNHVIEDYGEEQKECFYFLANNYAYLGLFEKAERTVSRYLQLCPDGSFSEDAHDLLELLQLERQSLNEWDNGQAERSDELIIEHEKARELLQQGKLQEAIPVLQDILLDYPTCWAAQNHLAEALFRLGDDSSFTICEQVLAKDEGNLFAICNLALFFLRKKEKLIRQSLYSSFDSSVSARYRSPY